MLKQFKQFRIYLSATLSKYSELKKNDFLVKMNFQKPLMKDETYFLKKEK